jgi:hypothetical protein
LNITQGTKRVGNLTVTGFNPAAPALGTSATSVYPGARLEANHIRQNRLDINATAVAMTRVNGGPTGTSRIRTLNIDPAGGALDLNDNDLIVTGGTLATITGQIKTGLENGGAFDWLGPGIRSTEANVRNAVAGSFLYGLGVILNDLAQVGGVGPIYASFSGQVTSGINDVLVKFTYFGDADLSGAVDATDYSLIDNGYVNGLSGWLNGDFDYSGVIDATDYALIDNAYVNQSGVLAETMIAQHTRLFGGEYLAALAAVRSGVVPEPLSFWPCLLPLIPACSYRRPGRPGRRLGELASEDHGAARQRSPGLRFC